MAFVKGMYSVVSAFLLITIIVFAVLFLAFLGSNSVATMQITSSQIEPLQKSKYELSFILDCWEKAGGFTRQNLSSKPQNFCLLETSSGYSVEIVESFGCGALKKSFGKTDDCTSKLPYFVAVPDEKGNNCLGVLSLCYEVKG